MGHHGQGRGSLRGIVEHVQRDVIQVSGVEVQPACEASQGRDQGRHRRWGRRGHRGHLGEGVVRKFCNHLTSDPLHNISSIMLFYPISLTAGDPPPSNQSHEVSLFCHLSSSQTASGKCPSARAFHIMPYVGDK